MAGITNTSYIVSLNNKELPESVGSKARNLQILVRNNCRVPLTVVCTWDAYLAYLRNDGDVLGDIREELNNLLDSGAAYAVRSSADAEDSLEHSFAGQFKTCLDVTGPDRIVSAVEAVWQSARSATTRAYLERIDPEGTIQLKMAVIIQQMVNPVLSGVAFSKNPITAFDEVVVESVVGSGTALVQDGYSPQRWINKWGGWIEQPENPDIPIELAQEIVEQTKRLSHILDRDLDLEWIYDGQDLFWVQVRDITATDVPNLYSNKIARETTPGLVQPLAWSVTVPIPSRAWINLITEVIGENDLEADNLMHAFRFRAYHNMGVFGRVFDGLGLPRESLEMVMGVVPPGAGKPPIRPSLKTIKLLPRFARFLWDKWTFAGKLEEHYPRLYQESRRYSIEPPSELDEHDLLVKIDQIIPLSEETSYYTIVTIILMQIYNGLLKVRLRALGFDFQEFDLTDGMTELKQYDPNVSIAALHQQYEHLDESKREEIRSGGYAALQQMTGIEDFQESVAAFFDQYGHLSDSTGHFGKKPWRESRDLVIELITSFEAPQELSSNRIRLEDLPLKGMKGRLFKILYHRARQFRFLREMYSLLFSYYLMLFRAYYLAIGERLVKRQLIANREDILFLYDDEVRAFIGGQRSGAEFSQLVEQRKVEMALCENVIMPDVIFGDALPPIITTYSDKLSGTPTSRGYHTGPVKLVLGVHDFPKLESGDVLVIPYSDVSWTPLFAKAGAVVAESGGILSHSSIIAREYGLPAVVSVSGATHHLQDGMSVTVDGYKGEVTIHDSVFDTD